MKNAKYLISTIMICLLLVMGLAACSGPANEPVTDPDTEVTEEISDEDVELTILDPEEEDASDDTAAEEQAESGSSSDSSGKSGSSDNSSKSGSSSDDGLIGEDEAIKIVLKRVKGATKDDIVSFEKDYDDGRWQYEGSLVYDGLEYEFEIDAQNGNILDWEIDD